MKSIPRYSKRAIYQRADINTDSIGVTYFPYPEPTEKVGYACGIYGCNAVLRQGNESGAYYAAGTRNSCGNEDGCSPYGFRESFGNRERDIIARLDHIEQDEPGEGGRAVFSFVARTGERFTVATFDYGHTWEICG